MKIISFDVGTKNLAYCIFDVNVDKSYIITGWGILDLINKPVYQCCAKQKKNHTLYVEKKQHTLIRNLNIIVNSTLKAMYWDYR